MNLAEAVVRQLTSWEVPVVFGVVGDDLLPFLDAVGRQPGLRWIGMAHEAGAAYAAASWARLTGGLGVCAASAAGAVNLADGLMEAGLDGVPVLALTGQVALAELGGQVKQYFDQQRLIGTAAVFSALVADATAGPSLLTRAAAEARARKGPAHLSFPADLWTKGVEAAQATTPGAASGAAGDGAWEGTPVHPGRLMAELSRAVATDAILVLDVGALTYWFEQRFPVRTQTVLASSRWRSMGRALPGALAAQLRFPERQVVALVGDGGLLMSLGELATLSALRAPVKVVVADNRKYGLEADKAAAQGLEPPGLDVLPVDFARCAEACGVRGRRVETPGDLAGVLAEVLAGDGPALLDVVCADTHLPHYAGNS